MYSIAKGAEGRFLRFKLWAERISAAAIHLYCTMSYYSSIKVKNFDFLTLQAKCKNFYFEGKRLFHIQFSISDSLYEKVSSDSCGGGDM